MPRYALRSGRPALAALALLAAWGASASPEPAAAEACPSFSFGTNGLVSVGDLDGDRRPEFVVGFTKDVVVDGVPIGGTRVLSGADGSILRDFPAADAIDAGLDCDGDGAPDIALGYATAKAAKSQRGGRVEIRSGKDGRLLASAEGTMSNEGLGGALAFGGSRLAVGCPTVSPKGVSKAGMVKLFDAKTMTLLRTIPGTTKDGQYGSRIAGSGPDPKGPSVFFVSQCRPLGGDKKQWEVRAVLEEESQDAAEPLVATSLSFALVPGGPRGLEFVAGLPWGLESDIDRDTRLVWHDPGKLRSFQPPRDIGPGAVRNYSRSREEWERSLQPRLRVPPEDKESRGPLKPKPYGNIGDEVAPAGDLDKDGTPDVFVSTMIGGSDTSRSAGWIWAFSGENGKLIRKFEGQAASEHMGADLCGAGDIDLDGVPDLLATGFHTLVRAYSGATGKPLFEVDDQRGTADYAKRKKAASPPPPAEPPAGK